MSGFSTKCAPLTLVCALLSPSGLGMHDCSAEEPRHYLFSYFLGNGEDGLHLAHSQDGYHWSALDAGRSFLAPTTGRDKLMRDPSITRGPDGTFPSRLDGELGGTRHRSRLVRGPHPLVAVNSTSR